MSNIPLKILKFFSNYADVIVNDIFPFGKLPKELLGFCNVLIIFSLLIIPVIFILITYPNQSIPIQIMTIILCFTATILFFPAASYKYWYHRKKTLEYVDKGKIFRK
jgi:hypothetical protein